LQAVKVLDEHGILRWLLADEDGTPVEIAGRFLRFLQNRQLSPNTVAAYARDLTLFFRFLVHRGLDFDVVGPALVVDFLDFLTHLPVRRPGKQQALAVVTSDAGGSGRRRAGSSINRTMAAVSSFYEFVITVEVYEGDNPVRKVDDVASGRVAERHRPFMGRASRQRPVRRAVRVRTVRGLPRPMASARSSTRSPASRPITCSSSAAGCSATTSCSTPHYRKPANTPDSSTATARKP
jgi:integrase/recombinase XerD